MNKLKAVWILCCFCCAWMFMVGCIHCGKTSDPESEAVKVIVQYAISNWIQSEIVRPAYQERKKMTGMSTKNITTVINSQLTTQITVPVGVTNWVQTVSVNRMVTSIPEERIPKIIFVSNNAHPNISMALPMNYTPAPSHWLDALSALDLPVKCVTKATYSHDVGYVTDMTTGQAGLIVNIDEIIWKSDSEVEIIAGGCTALGCGGGGTFVLKRVGGRWHIADIYRHWLD